MKIFGDDGRLLEAELEIEPTPVGCSIVVHANGGASRGRPAHNPDYIPALETTLKRLREMDGCLDGLWVDSRAVAHLSAEKREIRPGGRSCPIPLRSIDDLKLFRLEIRRGVSRTSGRAIESVGTGNKRIRLQVSVPPGLVQTIEQTLVSGHPTLLSGYWLEAATKTHERPRRTVQIPWGLPLLGGHLVVQVVPEGWVDQRNLRATPLRCDVWYVDHLVSQDEAGGDSRFAPRVAELVRMTETSVLEQHPSGSADIFAGIDGDKAEQWMAIDDAKLVRIIELLGISIEDLPIPTPPLAIAGPQQRAIIWSTVSSAAPVVKERISKYIERGPAGDLVKAANGYRCQICEALGLPALGFPKADGTPFVEAHHVIPVSTLEKDVLGPANVIVVCPNHHRQLHLGGAVQLDEACCFRFEFPFDQPTVRVKKFVDRT